MALQSELAGTMLGFDNNKITKDDECFEDCRSTSLSVAHAHAQAVVTRHASRANAAPCRPYALLLLPDMRTPMFAEAVNARCKVHGT